MNGVVRTVACAWGWPNERIAAVNYERPGRGWWDNRVARADTTPEVLAALAERCERLAPDDQRLGFERALRLLSDMALAPKAVGEGGDDDTLWVALLADSGAYESAALALFPPQTVYSGGRLLDGAFVAQVILPGGVGAHSRAAKSLAMAWLAALLRALAREMIEARALH